MRLSMTSIVLLMVMFLLFFGMGGKNIIIFERVEKDARGWTREILLVEKEFECYI